jgi:hypothetical protein
MAPVIIECPLRRDRQHKARSITNSIRFLCLFCVFCSGGSTLAAETRDLILVAGQSNAVGYDAKPSELPADAADKDILFWWRTGDPPPDEHDSTSGGKWTHLQPQSNANPNRQFGNFANPDGGFGPEIGLARELYAKGNKQLAIIKTAWGGTAMAQCWNPADPGDGGSCYRAMLSETTVAIATARAQDITLRLHAFVWVQGESDANATAAPSYEKALGDMIAALRKDLDSPQLIVLLAVNTRYGGGANPFMRKIVEAQQALAAKDSRCAYVDTASATIANTLHFDSAGTLDVGHRFAEALLKIEAKAAATSSSGASLAGGNLR